MGCLSMQGNQNSADDPPPEIAAASPQMLSVWLQGLWQAIASASAASSLWASAVAVVAIFRNHAAEAFAFETFLCLLLNPSVLQVRPAEPECTPHSLSKAKAWSHPCSAWQVPMVACLRAGAWKCRHGGSMPGCRRGLVRRGPLG
eukprot:1157373-Pelagomonas_calceolata.AAC.3